MTPSSTPRTILFVCTGNTCRSPMAEAIAGHWLRVSGHGDWLAASAGTHASSGQRPSREAIQALSAANMSCDSTSTPLTAELVDGANIVLCLTQSHLHRAETLAGGEGTRIELLDPTGDILDPVGCGQAAYDALVDHLQGVIPKRLEEIMPHAN
ncbi:MAG: hypothetical protein QGH76_00105 [Phycisphaerales bacterium]|jgi:protein-tyrosine-phosphatase|nr:hypothetical protein [Phycisphaerales bacterium]